jgi:hypothetical protein
MTDQLITDQSALAVAAAIDASAVEEVDVSVSVELGAAG